MSSASMRSTSASTAPPLALTPSSRALITAVSLTTSRSPACSRSGRSRTWRSRAGSARASSRRAALRSAAGCWAISSRGSAKSKSLKRRPGDVVIEGQNSPMAPPSRRESKASATGAAVAAPRPASASAPDPALAKLGLVRDIDLALHLPLRYEDETRIVAIASLHDGETGQVEGVVSDSRIQFRPRRQLVVKIADDSGDLVMRFLHFYPSQQKTLAAGKRVRVRGETRGGFFGLEMVHPAFKVVTAETPLPTALTPVNPSMVQLSQAYLRKAVAAGRARADLDEHL